MASNPEADALRERITVEVARPFAPEYNRNGFCSGCDRDREEPHLWFCKYVLAALSPAERAPEVEPVMHADTLQKHLTAAVIARHGLHPVRAGAIVDTIRDALAAAPSPVQPEPQERAWEHTDDADAPHPLASAAKALGLAGDRLRSLGRADLAEEAHASAAAAASTYLRTLRAAPQEPQGERVRLLEEALEKAATRFDTIGRLIRTDFASSPDEATAKLCDRNAAYARAALSGSTPTRERGEQEVEHG